MPTQQDEPVILHSEFITFAALCVMPGLRSVWNISLVYSEKINEARQFP